VSDFIGALIGTLLILFGACGLVLLGPWAVLTACAAIVFGFLIGSDRP
jgi:hypothetical protein